MKLSKIIPLIIISVLCLSKVTHASAAQRIVSLKPTITDVIVALGEGQRLVGVTRYCDTSSLTPKPAIAGDYTQPFIERIIALSPDIILGSQENSSRRSIEQIERMGMRAEILPFSTVNETFSSIKKIGVLLGVPEKGDGLAREMKTSLISLKEKWSTSSIKRLIIVWGTRPLIVAGPGSYMDELLAYIGAKNAVMKTQIHYPRLGLEELIALDPDAIIDLSMGSEALESLGSAKPWDGVGILRAVREKQVISLDASMFRAGPKLPEALNRLAKMLHGP